MAFCLIHDAECWRKTYLASDIAAATVQSALDLGVGMISAPMMIGHAPEQLLNTPTRVWEAASKTINGRNGYERWTAGSQLVGEISSGFLAIVGMRIARGAMKGPTRPKRHMRNCCFAAGTLVATAAGVAIPIEDIDVGDRVATHQGGSASIVDDTWRKALLTVANHGDVSHLLTVEILRPQQWFEQVGATKRGDSFFITLREIGIQGRARVEGFGSATIEAGPGRVVLTTVTHKNNDVYELSFVEGSAPLRGTGGHPLYSLDRGDWALIRDLRVGERLQTAEGAVTIEALEKVRGEYQVFNLEVEGDHEYLVGDAGVRAHNTSPCSGGQQLSFPFADDAALPRAVPPPVTGNKVSGVLRPLDPPGPSIPLRSGTEGPSQLVRGRAYLASMATNFFTWKGTRVLSCASTEYAEPC